MVVVSVSGVQTRAATNTGDRAPGQRTPWGSGVPTRTADLVKLFARDDLSALLFSLYSHTLALVSSLR